MKQGYDWRQVGLGAALASALFLGMAPIFGKQAILLGFSPRAVVVIRTTLAAGLLFILMLAFSRKYLYIYPIGFYGCLLAGVVNGLGSVLYYSALGRIDASLGSLLYSLYPIFAALWLMIDRQPIQRLTILRLTMILPAIYLITSTGRNTVDLAGVVMMLGAACLYAFHVIINQRILYEVPAPTVTLYTLLAMSVVTVVAYFGFDRQPLPEAVEGSIFELWWPVLGLALITFLSRITLFMGVKHLGGMRTTLLGLGELLVAILAAHWLLGDALTATQWIGAVFLTLILMSTGLEKLVTERKHTSGWLAWLDPPQVPW